MSTKPKTITEDNGKRRSDRVMFTLRIPRSLVERIDRYIDAEHEGQPHLRNWFITQWISEGLKREGKGY
jgi:hypothetical protein